MPHHWRRRRDRDAYPDFEARAWAVGQVVSARAALRLLASQADDSDETHRPPWPEFAALDCYACHHDLRPDAERPKAAVGKPGALPLNNWYFAMLAHTPGGKRKSDVVERLNDLRRAIAQPRSPRAEVAARARAALATLDGWPELLEARGGTAGDVAERLRQLAGASGALRGAGWDDAAQVYLALVAHHHSWKDLEPHGPPPGLRPALVGLGKLLEFPHGRTGPAWRFAPKDVDDQLQRVHKLLAPK
jgi:hypothetical protein